MSQVTQPTTEYENGRITGSFRDPCGYVFEREGRIHRAIDGELFDTLKGLFESGDLTTLIHDHDLIETAFVIDEELLALLEAEHPGYRHFLEHRAVETITYPYEWCFSMLADAALLTLDLQERLLARGASLKDATAYNVQFSHARAVFIDVASIERPHRLDVWYALGQFNQMFTFPLLLASHHGWDLRSYFLGRLNGRSVAEAALSLGWLGCLRPRVLFDVTLPHLLNRRANKTARTAANRLECLNQDPTAQKLTLRRLRRKIQRMAARYPFGTDWTTYTSVCSYTSGAEKAKKALVGQFLAERRPGDVLDAGCNTGDYSYLAASTGARVTAIDADEGAVESLYRRLKTEPVEITPLIVDLANPSPAIGFMNRERRSALDRLAADCVLALALAHHLRVTANFSVDAICELFFSLTRDLLVIEFVPQEDEMFQRLLQYRREGHDDFTLENFRERFSERFTLLKEEPIPGSLRTLFFFQKNSP